MSDSDHHRAWRFYGGIDNDIIWTLVQEAVPKLLPILRDLLRATTEDSL